MTDVQREVWDEHPSAVCVYNSDRGTFKVYYSVPNPQLLVNPPGEHVHRDATTRVALSGSWESAGMAWADAADAVRKRRERQCQTTDSSVMTNSATN